VIRVLMSATSEIVRAGLEALLTASPALAVVGSAPDVATLAHQAEDLQPDVILAQLETSDDDTLAALLALGIGSHPPAIVVLTDDVHSTWATEALRVGIRAILPRQASAGEIVATVEAAAAGLVVLHRDAVESLLLIPPSAPRALPASPNQALTPREIEVLGMLAEGLGNKAIAWRLDISEHTVKFHVGSILAKLNASSRTEAVTLGIRQGLIML
jgi:two-component system, NarL family, response regulator YdfI